MARTQQAAQANITLQEQIEAIHKAKGLVGEDDGKEKIGPSKPHELRHQPPISSPILPRPNLPMQVPRPQSSVSSHRLDKSLFGKTVFIVALRNDMSECLSKMTLLAHAAF